MSDLIWYAAYGSNLSAERFASYLDGGLAPHATIERRQRGARDPSRPAANRSWEIPHRLFFASSWSGWGGGAVAFLDPTAHVGQRALVRLWLLTAQQFEDVFRQENGLPIPAADDDEPPLFTIDGVRPGDHLDATGSWYGRVLHLGPGPDGHSVATFTGADAESHDPGAADLSYLRTMGIGLMERFRFTPARAALYLAERDGNAGQVDARALTEDLARWRPSS